MDVNETLPRFLLLLRFLCFVAVVYLILHVLFARLISKPDSKVLWFFSTLTMPLTWPIRGCYQQKHPTPNFDLLRWFSMAYCG